MDQHEFEQFVLENGKNILRFCRLTCQDTESGDELYQDTMLKLLDKRQQLDNQQNVQSYALSISILLWKNKKKKYANRNRLIPMESMDAMEHDKISELKEESAPSPETCILQADEKKMIQKIVSDLPEKFRIPIHLYYSAVYTRNCRNLKNTGRNREKPLEQGKTVIKKRTGGNRI